jgi:dienelactone hydrolase
MTWTAGWICVVLSLGRTRADEDLNVLPPPTGKATASPLYDALHREAEAALERREKAYEQVKTADQAREWQRIRREFFLRQLGPFPERTPLNGRVTGTLEGEGYRLEKVLFASRPGHHITASFYLPTSKPPYPGVIIPCGHSFNGKAAEGYQRVSILLARHGIAALCYDPLGQGERYQTFGPDGQPLGRDYVPAPSSERRLATIPGRPRFSPTDEHTLIGIGAILLGSNAATYRIWDGMRAIDYLVSRPEIDPKRIGCTGNSGGGTLTSYLMALDERIVCAAPACYLTTFRRLLATSGPQDAEQNIFGQAAFGLDEADYVLLRAPKPTLLCAGTRDTTFAIEGTWDIFREAKRFYDRFGLPEQVEMVEADEPHGFTRPLRIGAVRWMRRWLLGKTDPITEPDFPIHSDAELFCTPKGQVLWMPGERSIFDFQREEAEALATRRAAFWKETPRPAALETIRRLIGARPLAELPPAKERKIGTVARDGYRIDKLLLTVRPGIDLPALRFVPDKPAKGRHLYLHDGGKQVDAAPGGPIEKLVRQGSLVLAVDLSGFGETYRRHSKSWGDRLFGQEASEFFLAYLLGKSLVGLRTEEIQQCARHLAEYDTTGMAGPIHLVAIGATDVPALHAHALEPKLFASRTPLRSVESWTAVVRAAVAGQQLRQCVHGALQVYDLPDLAR